MSMISTMLWSVRLNCVRNQVSRARKRCFKADTVQEVNTYIQQAHGSPSVKGCSRSAHKQRAHITKNNLDQTDKSSLSSWSKKATTKRPVHKAHCCPFHLIIFCSSIDQKWYLRHSGPKNITYSMTHSDHMPMQYNHANVSINNVPDEAMKYIDECLQEQITAPLICNLVRSRYNVSVSEKLINRYRHKMLYDVLDECNDKPYGTPVDRLISLFTARNDVSFVYITHHMESGYVTHRKTKNDKNSLHVNTDKLNDGCIPVHHHEVDAWRKQLRVSNKKELLVAFAWCHDDELRAVKMFPEFLAVDMTFGVNKEQRNLLLIAGIDGHNNVFTAYHCFMPSKQTCAYTWALKEAARYLLTEQVLEHNKCFACDQEQALFMPLREMMSSTNYLAKSHHRLDQFHLFKKEWKDNVVNKVNGNDANNALYNMQRMLSDIFSYIETPAEMKMLWCHVDKYYASVRDVLRSDACCDSIDRIIQSLKNNINYIAHYMFKHVTTFDFVGDCIAEAANSGIKNGSIRVTTNMNLGTSGMTQVKILQNQNEKKLRCVCVHMFVF
jgi:hypothetical protein